MEVSYFDQQKTKVEQQKTKVDYFDFLPPELIVEIIKYIISIIDVISFSLTTIRHLNLVKSYSIVNPHPYIHSTILKRYSLTSIKNYLKYYEPMINYEMLYFSCKNCNPKVMKLIMCEYNKLQTKLVIYEEVTDIFHLLMSDADIPQLQMIMTFANIKIDGINIDDVIKYLVRQMSLKDYLKCGHKIIRNINFILPFNMDKLSDTVLFDLLFSLIQKKFLRLFKCILNIVNLTFNEITLRNGELDIYYRFRDFTKHNILYYITIISIRYKDLDFTNFILSKYNISTNFIIRFLSSFAYTFYDITNSIELLNFHINSYIEISKEDILDSNILIRINNGIENLHNIHTLHNHDLNDMLLQNLNEIFRKLQITKKDIDKLHVDFLKEICGMLDIN